MDRRAIIFATAAAFGCLAFACGKGDAEPGADRQAVEIEVTVDGQPLSRVTTSGNRFENGDKFRFFFNSAIPTSGNTETPKGDNALKITDYVYRSGSGKWETAQPVYWDDHKPVTREFCAVMPFDIDYTVGAGLADHKFTVQAVQSLPDSTGYKKSDLLMARVSTAERLIPLKFHHLMAKVVVEVKASTKDTDPAAFGETAFDEMTASLNNIYRTGELTFNNLTSDATDYNPAVTVTGDTDADDVAMLELAAAEHKIDALTMRFTALIPPQTVTAGKILLTFANVEGADAKTYYMKAPAGGAVFEQGKSTLVTVTLKKAEVEIAEDAGIKIVRWSEMDVEVDDPIVLPD